MIEQKIGAIVDSILQDYSLGRDIDRLDTTGQPDREVIVDLTHKLMRIIYPGWSRNKHRRIYNARHDLSMLIEDVTFHLTEQTELILRPTLGDGASARAQEITLAFLERIPAIRAVAQTDLTAFFDGDPAAFSTDEIVFCYPGLFAVTVYRLAHELYLLKVPMLPRIMTEHAHSATGIDINPGATIGDHFFIDHGTGIVIGETTVIGSRVKIYQGVTLGALTTRGGQSLRGQRRHPTIEDDVTIYAGASILGGNTVIGRDCVIGSNVFITHSIPPCTTVSVKSQELQYKPRNCQGCSKAEPFWDEQRK